MDSSFNLIILIFLYCIIATSIPFILFNFYKIFEKHILTVSKETDPLFLEEFNNLRDQIIPEKAAIELYTNYKFLTLFCACEASGTIIKIHIHKSLKKDLDLYKSAVAHELFHAKDIVNKVEYSDPYEKELYTDMRSSIVVGRQKYIKLLKHLQSKWYAWEGMSHPKWEKRIKQIAENTGDSYENE